MPIDDKCGSESMERIYKDQPSFTVDFSKLSNVSVEAQDTEVCVNTTVTENANFKDLAVNCETISSTSNSDTQDLNEGKNTYRNFDIHGEPGKIFGMKIYKSNYKIQSNS